MRKPIVFLFLFAVIASSYYGIKNHTKVVEHLPKQGKKETAQQKLSACYPLLEDQSFVAIVLGGNVFGWTLNESQSFDILDQFVAEGYNFIDTADIYSAWAEGNKGGESETVIGN